MRIIDKCDEEWVSKSKFSLEKNRGGYERVQITLRLHDLVISADVRQKLLSLVEAIKIHRSNGIVDHINRRTFDNRRENLRYVTNRQNQLNSRGISSRKGKPLSSKYRGVCYDSRYPTKPWKGAVYNHKGHILQKWFATEYEAASFRDKIIKELYPNDRVHLNQPKEAV